MKRIITLGTLALLLAAAGSLQAGEREHEPGRHHERPHHGKAHHHEHEARHGHHRHDGHPVVRRIRTRERIVVRERHRPAWARETHRHGWHQTHVHTPWIERGPRCVQRRTVVRERIVREPSWHDGEVTLFINYPIWY